MTDTAQLEPTAFTTARAAQPRWALPGLLLVAAAAGLAYAWGMDGALLEPYYAAAVRSMALDWRNLVYGAFDPAGTVTLDKLPGAFWPQALSVRLFGVHAWAIVLPQVVEGVLAVLVLYRAVRRLAGPAAGLVAAAVLAASPVTVALNRGNISDTLMTLLLVLAADATSSAVLTGRFIFASGEKVLPIGGFAGSAPVPSLARLEEQVANGEFHLVVALPTGDPRYAWIALHCAARGRIERAEIYYCRPADAQAPPAGR